MGLLRWNLRVHYWKGSQTEATGLQRHTTLPVTAKELQIPLCLSLWMQSSTWQTYQRHQWPGPTQAHDNMQELGSISSQSLPIKDFQILSFKSCSSVTHTQSVTHGL